MSRASQRRGLTPRAFASARSRHELWIARAANRLADGDRDLEDDLRQVGQITLWRTDAADTPDTIRRKLRRRMYDHRRARSTRLLVA
jgi:hypothetical protein